jgi:hypothetical protein
MTDVSKDTESTTATTGDKGEGVIVQPDSMNPHIVPDKDEVAQAAEE